ncbi:hypothetical protein DFP73DRAFT_593400 [Morchella snyderi]|nr:hypothetical protein DFP73DRAFT_593400 [Morchella snyderi]
MPPGPIRSTAPSSSPALRRADNYSPYTPVRSVGSRHLTPTNYESSRRRLFTPEYPNDNDESQDTIGRSQESQPRQLDPMIISPLAQRDFEEIPASQYLQYGGGDDDVTNGTRQARHHTQRIVRPAGVQRIITQQRQQAPQQHQQQWQPRRQHGQQGQQAEEHDNRDVDEAAEENVVTINTILSEEEVLAVLQEYINNGEVSSGGGHASRRHYDNSKMAGLFTKKEAWAAINRTARITFARWLTIPEPLFLGIIDGAAEEVVKRDSPGFTEAWNRLLEWRKNWLKEYNSRAGAMWADIVAKPEYSYYTSLEENHLRAVYETHWSYEAWVSLHQGSTAAFIDWRQTLAIPAAEDLYKTIFVYTMIYTHLLKMGMGMTRETANRRILKIGTEASFEVFKTEHIICLPVRPVHKTRARKKKDVGSLAAMDPNFIPFVRPSAAAANVPATPTTVGSPATAAAPNSQQRGVMDAQSGLIDPQLIPETQI